MLGDLFLIAVSLIAGMFGGVVLKTWVDMPGEVGRCATCLRVVLLAAGGRCRVHWDTKVGELCRGSGKEPEHQ